MLHLLSKRVTNNKTEDTLYAYSGTYIYADSLADLVVNKHLTRMDAQSVVSFAAGTNITFEEASKDGKFALLYKINNGERICSLDISYELLGLMLIKGTHICTRGAIIFKMADCKPCKEAVKIYDGMIAEQKLKNYMSITDFAELLGVNAQTLRNWDKAGKLKPALTTDHGGRMYTFEQSLEYLMERRDTGNTGIGYVVKRDNVRDSEKAIKGYFKTIGCEDYMIMEDEESGLSNRVTFQDVLRSVLRGKVSHLAIVDKNMALPLSSLELLEITLKLCGCKLHRIY